ncbi:caspase family protein [Lentzea sp. NPDC006480]|uniref:caspase family protein n=1 Tax=Lentzea sp. NPDC006480 TaxID=3157176 RepID=UPI0033B37E0C
MTTVIDRGTDGPRTHALVIGVGLYPHCRNDIHDGPDAALARQFTTLTAPPLSALEVTRWLLAEQLDEETAPLGSIELLVSGNADQTVTTPDGTVTVDSPTYPAVEAAFDRWRSRCDANEGNVAFFFFSGHGCAKGKQYLPLEDVGRRPGSFFSDAIELDSLVHGMGRNRASVQTYFIDACRMVPAELLDKYEINARSLLDSHLVTARRDAPVVYSTVSGEVARAVEGRPSPFTEAMLQALSGSAAAQPNGRWEVTTDRLVSAINRIRAWHGDPEQLTEYGLGTQVTGRTIRRLKGMPQVPFRLGCNPREALLEAQLSLLVPFSDQVAFERRPEPRVWEGSTDAQVYGFRAAFGPGRYVDSTKAFPLWPPNYECDLDVLPHHDDAGGLGSDANG